MTPPRTRTAVTALLLALLLAACGAGDLRASDALPDPREGRSGLQVTGSFDGRQVAVSDGLPHLLVGDCEARFGMAVEVCFASRTVDGATLVVGLGNPETVAAAGRADVARHGCTSASDCEEVADVAVVEVAVDGQRRPAAGGSLSLRVHEPGRRYAGDFRLRVAGGQLSGTFDVVPRPDEG